MINHISENHEEIYFDSFVGNIHYILDFYSSKRLTYRRFEAEFFALNQLIVTYYEENKGLFNLDETLQLLGLIHKINIQLRQEIYQTREQVIQMFSDSARMSKNASTADKIKVFRLMSEFIQDKHNPEYFEAEGIIELMKHLTLTLSTKQVTYYEFLELAGIIDVFQSQGQGFASEEELKMLTISFARQCLGLKFGEYTELVNILTVLDVMGEKFEAIEHVKQELLDRVQTSYIGGVR